MTGKGKHRRNLSVIFGLFILILVFFFGFIGQNTIYLHTELDSLITLNEDMSELLTELEQYDRNNVKDLSHLSKNHRLLNDFHIVVENIDKKINLAMIDRMRNMVVVSFVFMLCISVFGIAILYYMIKLYNLTIEDYHICNICEEKIDDAKGKSLDT